MIYAGRLRLRCYLCTQDITGDVVLAAPLGTALTDRVFIMCSERCAARDKVDTINATIKLLKEKAS